MPTRLRLCLKPHGCHCLLGTRLILKLALFFSSQIKFFVLLNLFPGVRESVLVFPDAVNDLK